MEKQTSGLRPKQQIIKINRGGGMEVMEVLDGGAMQQYLCNYN